MKRHELPIAEGVKGYLLLSIILYVLNFVLSHLLSAENKSIEGLLFGGGASMGCFIMGVGRNIYARHTGIVFPDGDHPIITLSSNIMKRYNLRSARSLFAYLYAVALIFIMCLTGYISVRLFA